MDDDLLLCECGHAGREKLEYIATTGTGPALRTNGRPFLNLNKRTGFYFCNGCEGIFKHTIQREGEIPDTEFKPERIRHFTLYKGRLSWVEIYGHAKNCAGDIAPNDELRIARASH